ncbi:MAG: hypothetical protein RLZZ65_1832 [Bacteroidota bacterium]|jgi:transglutaminase/protease-like cytokinesis protein 3
MRVPAQQQPKAVCAGFADLYTELGKRVGLNIKTVTGYSKGFGYTQGDDFSSSNHAWNAIEIEGQWHIFDATWGQGYGIPGKNGELVCVKQFNPDWFDIEPEYAIFTHLPYYTPRDLYAKNLQPYQLIAEVKRKKK